MASVQLRPHFSAKSPKSLFLPQAGTLHLTGPGGTDPFNVGPKNAPEVLSNSSLEEQNQRDTHTHTPV